MTNKKDKPFNGMYKRKYKMLQISEEAHTILKEYCKHHHFVMSGFVESLIKQSIKGKK